MPSPLLDHDPRLRQRVEDLTVEQLVAQLAVEAFHIAVLPGTGLLDERRLGPDRGDPLAHRQGDELGTLIRADMIGDSTFEAELGQHLDDVDRAQTPGDADRQALPRELVQDAQHSVLPPVMGTILDEVVSPDVVWPLGPQPDAQPVRQPQSPAFGLLLRYLQPLPAPDPLDPLPVHAPSCMPQ